MAYAAHQMGIGGRSVPTFSIATTIPPSPPTQAVDGDKLLKRMAARAERQAQRREAHHGFGGRGPNPPPAFSGAEGGENESTEVKGVATTTTTTTPVGGEQATATAAAAEAEAAVEGERRRKVRWDEGERMQKKFLKWVERKLKRRGEGGENGKGQRGRSHSKSHSSSGSSSGSSSSPSPSHSRRGGKASHSPRRSHSPSRLGRGHRHCATDAAAAPHPAWKQCKEGGKGRGGGMRRMKHKVRAWLAEKMGWVVVDGGAASHHHGHHHHHYHHHHEGVCAAK